MAAENNQLVFNPVSNHSTRAPNPAPPRRVTEVYDRMRGFIRATHWSKPYYSALIHNNPTLPSHLLEHVNCTYLSTPGRAPTLLALKQHAQSLAVLISMLAPAEFGGTLPSSSEGKTNGDDPFAAEQAFDWLNDLEAHYNTEDRAHKKPLNALANLIKSNSDTEGPKWHCPLDTTGMEFPENHPFQQHRPFETHMLLLMHANEVLERLDHEYSAMGGILGIIPLDSDEVSEQPALQQAKTTLVGQWILYTQHLVARMHELEIAYGNSLDLLKNEAIVPMQHLSIHGPDGRSGREIVFPQDRWVLANAGEDVFTFIHQMLDRAEAHQDAQDDTFARQNVLGDAAFSNNEELKYRGIVKADLSTRFYRLRGSGHGPLFVLPAFGDRASTQNTRDMEKRPTVIAIPQPSSKETVSSWESRHKDVDAQLLRLTVDKSNLEAKVSMLNSSLEMRDREIDRMNEIQKQYDGKINDEDKNLARQITHLNDIVRLSQNKLRETEEREAALKEEVENFKKANISARSDADPVGPLVTQVNDQQVKIRNLEKEVQEREKKVEDLQRDNDTLRILQNSPLNGGSSAQVNQLVAQLANSQQVNQMRQQENYKLKKSKAVKGKILNFPTGFKLDYGSTFEDADLGMTACSSTFFKALLAADKERNDQQRILDKNILDAHATQSELDRFEAENERLQKESELLRSEANKSKPSKIINLPWGLQHTSTFRDDKQGLIVLRTDWYDHLIASEKSVDTYTAQIAELQQKLTDLKMPSEVKLSGLYNAVKDKLAGGKVYKDSKRNLVVLSLGHYDELQKRDQAKSATQQQLDESQKNVEALQQQLEDARTQLGQHLSKMDIDSEQEDLRNQLSEMQIQLEQSLEYRTKLEDQINTLTTDQPASDLKQQAADLQSQLAIRTKEYQEKESEAAELQRRYSQLQLNETNLRTEMMSLRRQLSETRLSEGKDQPASSSQTPISRGQDGEDELRTAKAEVQLYKGELSTVQSLWDDLQTQHVGLQTKLENAQREYNEEKARLQKELDESLQTNNVLEMKVGAEPTDIPPLVAELEEQRDEARDERDQLRERLDDSMQTNDILQMKVLAEPSRMQPAFIEIEAQLATVRDDRDEARSERDKLRRRVAMLEKLRRRA
ncbi:hypothetical protein F5X97DRAFT_306389 [Nemania serpens]|nr:hypothetical protein F5X97DRAFT_306389 [Nemania serpens]